MQKEKSDMTIKQLIRRLNSNASQFADVGDLNRAIAASECAALLKRNYSHVKGHIEI